MNRHRLPAVFMRGGTSKALMLHRQDLPAARGDWAPIFLRAMGSPDPNGRQLDGMGGGLSSVSKVCVLSRSSRADADIDYTFAQVMVKDAHVDYGANCGNMSSAVGPFAVDEGLVEAADGQALVRIYNTNTDRIIHSTFPVQGGQAVEAGELAIPGVAGTGAPLRRDFLSPGGASTGRLLPTGNVVDRIDVPGLGPVEVSMVDAANACVLVAASSLGLSGLEMPADLEADAVAMERLSAIRLQASVAMGLARTIDEARSRTVVPFVGFVAPPKAAHTLSGESIMADAVDLTARMLSNGQPHRALPLTASLCIAVAASIEGTTAWRARRTDGSDGAAGGALRIAMPSGVLTVGAEVDCEAGQWSARRGSFYRTARRLFDGKVYY
ncbi:MAG: 2-methylaconitate cis-trans isomerase PrpF family protein [bacterium]